MPVQDGSPQVLICGAGPTGLVLALWLAKRQLPFRIIDKAPHAGIASRALVIQARTLEFYRMLGIDRSIVAHTRKVDQLRLWVRQRQAGTVFFGREAIDISPFPHFYVYPQDEHEIVLEQELDKLGIHVERDTELLSFEETAGGIDARLRTVYGATAETATIRVAWLAGCDGSHSKVRETLGADFPGGTYDPTYYVADIVASGPVVNNDLNLALDDADFLAVFPMRGEGRVRLVGTVADGQPGRQAPGDPAPSSLQWGDVSQDILDRLGIEIKTVNWFSTYRVHHRVASFFRKGRAFLCGDAAHVHSPVGGQGMNTGIGDAINLAWKLDAVWRGAPASLLDTYEQERRPFALSLVNTTDRVFTFVNRRSRLATMIRTRLVPAILPRLSKLAAIRRAAFRLVSQTRIHYRAGSLSTGAAGSIRGGDRLPWLERQDNYAPLCSLDWQVHCYGPTPVAVADWCEHTRIPLHAFAPSDRIPAGTACLIRPDGHIGWIGRSGYREGLSRYAEVWHLFILKYPQDGEQ
jgi:2-polyprenyl-6-methoxyphenol hydroxylase-like FAD-dependent oxidoreductase